MKKICIIFLLSIIISLTAIGFSGGLGVNMAECAAVQQQYLRIHIRADSNDNAAQAVKYSVRDEVVEYLTPVVAECETKDEAMQKIEARLDEIALVATKTLIKSGYYYGATAALVYERFPTRVYGEYTLPEGEYAALILRLGKGAGDNWWCVVYPPLCFAATQTNVVYKSKILEIIENWKNG